MMKVEIFSMHHNTLDQVPMYCNTLEMKNWFCIYSIYFYSYDQVHHFHSK